MGLIIAILLLIIAVGVPGRGHTGRGSVSVLPPDFSPPPPPPKQPGV